MVKAREKLRLDVLTKELKKGASVVTKAGKGFTYVTKNVTDAIVSASVR